MNKMLTFAALVALASTSANAADNADIAADRGAIAKDQKAIDKQDDNIAVNREKKADAKAKEDYVDQDSQSVQIGANKTAKEAKKLEKKADEEILEHDKKNRE